MNKLVLYHVGSTDGKRYTSACNTLRSCVHDDAFHHPQVVKWVMGEAVRAGAPPKFLRVLREYKNFTSIKRATTDPGIAGSSISDEDAKRLYEHWKDKILGRTFDDAVQFQILSRRVASTVAKIDAAEIDAWWNTIPTGTDVRSLKKKFADIAKRTVRVASKHMRIPVNDWKISWTAGQPVSVAVYWPGRSTLQLHEWVLGRFRRSDIVVLTLHEIIGHHKQEQNTALSLIPADAEGCAMMCEQIAGHQIWPNPKGTRCSLEKTRYEWELMRLVRAMVDVSLHSRTLPFNKRSETLWRQHAFKDKILRYPVLATNLVPLPDETNRCAALPAQAHSYLHVGTKQYTNCACNNVSAKQTTRQKTKKT